MISIRSFPISLSHSLIPLLIGCFCILAFIFDTSISEFLIYQRNHISNGQVWRLLSGHFFHTNGYHLLLNLAALVLLWALHGQFYTKKNYLFLFFCSTITCSFGLYFFSVELIQYVGLSGALHGIFIFGALFDIKAKDKTGYLLFFGAWIKIIHEQVYGASSDVINLIEANVAVDAHLWGAVGGMLSFLIIHFYSASQNKR